ncbi:hypothetical protein B0H13DRAFT_2663839 [Mycena leptocephala]|nr:hypothetical protein B0H13DRAFT_2663839 [Mycena leptocephala]
MIMVARRGTISDNYRLNTRTLTLKYGLRGLVYFKIPGRDLRSGVFGRTLREPMTYLMSFMGRLVDPADNTLISGGTTWSAHRTCGERARGKIALGDDKRGRVLLSLMLRRTPQLVHGAFGGRLLAWMSFRAGGGGCAICGCGDSDDVRVSRWWWAAKAIARGFRVRSAMTLAGVAFAAGWINVWTKVGIGDRQDTEMYDRRAGFACSLCRAGGWDWDASLLSRNAIAHDRLAVDGPAPRAGEGWNTAYAVCGDEMYALCLPRFLLPLRNPERARVPDNEQDGGDKRWREVESNAPFPGLRFLPIPLARRAGRLRIGLGRSVMQTDAACEDDVFRPRAAPLLPLPPLFIPKRVELAGAQARTRFG